MNEIFRKEESKNEKVRRIIVVIEREKRRLIVQCSIRKVK
jgi:hypothetical protein